MDRDLWFAAVEMTIGIVLLWLFLMLVGVVLDSPAPVDEGRFGTYGCIETEVRNV